MVQIFVKVDESDGGKYDGRQSRRRDETDPDRRGRVCGVTDGCTIQVTSRMREGERHKDKKSKSEKKQTTNPDRPEQKCDEESKSDEGPEMMHMEEALRRLEENEGYQKITEFVSEGSEEAVQQKVQDYVAGIQKLSWVKKEQLEYLGGGVRRAVEARINGNGDEQEQQRQGEQGQNPGQEQCKQGKQVRVGKEKQLRETRAKRTDELEVPGRLAEVRTGRGSAGLVQGRDERRWEDEISRKGKGNCNAGNCEHDRRWKERNTGG